MWSTKSFAFLITAAVLLLHSSNGEESSTNEQQLSTNEEQPSTNGQQPSTNGQQPSFGLSGGLKELTSTRL